MLEAVLEAVEQTSENGDATMSEDHSVEGEVAAPVVERRLSATLPPRAPSPHRSMPNLRPASIEVPPTEPVPVLPASTPAPSTIAAVVVLGQPTRQLERIELVPSSPVVLRIVLPLPAERVYVRLTRDDWLHHRDIEGAADGARTYTITLEDARPTDQLQFAVCQVRDGAEAWDAAEGSNWRVTVPGGSPIVQSTPIVEVQPPTPPAVEPKPQTLTHHTAPSNS